MFLTEIVVHTLRNKMETHRFYDLAYKKCNDLGNTGLGNTMLSWNVFVLFWIWMSNLATPFFRSSVRVLSCATNLKNSFSFPARVRRSNIIVRQAVDQIPSPRTTHFIFVWGCRTCYMDFGGLSSAAFLRLYFFWGVGGWVTSGFWISTVFSRQFKLHGAENL